MNQSQIYSQEIKATLYIDMQQVQPENRSYANSLERDLTSYLNNQRFTNINWQGPPIPVDISIYLTGGYNGSFGAKLFIASKRYLYGQEGGTSVTLKMIENQWGFDYRQSSVPVFNPLRFDSFISVLDFYILLIIGMDNDTYADLSGTPMFERAKQLCQLGSQAMADGFEVNSPPGKFTKYNLISELTDMRYEELRKLFYSYYSDGLDQMSKNKDTAMSNLVDVLGDMARFKKNKLASHSVLLEVFFDTKSRELATLFRGYTKDPDVFDYLIYLDPSNTSIYEDSRAGKEINR